MSNEVFQIIKQYNLKAVELQLILQCAPVLSGLKASNMLNIDSKQGKDVNLIVNDDKISTWILADNNCKQVILLYRKDELSEFLSEYNVRQMLMEMGYEDGDLEKLLYDFSKRYRNYVEGKAEFPHEMGLFLGYPVEDVRGFIENKGQNFLYSGYWKVYKDMRQKIELFEKFQQAEEVMIKQLYGRRMKR